MVTKIVGYVGFRNVKTWRMEKHVLELKLYKHKSFLLLSWAYPLIG